MRWVLDLGTATALLSRPGFGPCFDPPTVRKRRDGKLGADCAGPSLRVSAWRKTHRQRPQAGTVPWRKAGVVLHNSTTVAARLSDYQELHSLSSAHVFSPAGGPIALSLLRRSRKRSEFLT